MADYISTLTGAQMDSALIDMAEHNSEAYAVGERNGVPVASSDVTYHNNARYYAQQAQSIAPASVTEAVRWDIAQTALTDAQRLQARENIDAGKNGAWTNPSLLDNPFFSVNQRSWTTGSTNGYTVDRWRQYNCTTTVNADGSLNIASTSGGTSYENCPYDAFLIGKPVTLSVLYQNGTIAYGSITVPSSGTTYTSTFTDGTKLGLTITGTSTIGFSMALPANANVNVRAFKWELGSVSTLANDAPPDYGTELAKCQRYFVRLKYTDTGKQVGFGYMYNTTQARILIPTPVTMRVAPTVTTTNLGGAFRVNAGGTYLTPSSASATATALPNGVNINFVTSSAGTSGAIATVFSYGEGSIDLSADL